jgi:hypothetical protein
MVSGFRGDRSLLRGTAAAAGAVVMRGIDGERPASTESADRARVPCEDGNRLV